MRILLSAGEVSGDVAGSRLVRALRARRSDLAFFGLGGPRMAEAGVETLWRDGRQYVRTTEWQSRPDLDAAGHLLESAVRVTWREGAGQRSVLLVT